MVATPHIRHARYGHFSRQRYSKRLLAFLSGRAAALTASVTSKTAVIVHVAESLAAATLTNDGNNVTDGDTVTIDSKVYTFQGTLTNVDGHVKIGASNTASMTNLFHAINASGGTVGTDYATLTTAHPTVTATNPTGTTVVATAKAGSGASGNRIQVTEASSHLAWGAAQLAGGVTETFGPTVTVTGHGVSDGEGPYVLTSSNGNAHVPAGYSPGSFVYAHVVDANTLKLYGDHGLSDLQTYTDGGTGTISLAKPATSAGIYDTLKRQPAVVVAAATDIDNLA